MGNKQDNRNNGDAKRKSMRLGTLVLLCVLGIGLLGGMALFNRGVKPDRDMQWYVREGAMEVAAPALAEDAQSESDAEFVLPEDNMRATPTPEPTPTPSPTPELTPIPLDYTEQPAVTPIITPEAIPEEDLYAPEDGFEADADIGPDELDSVINPDADIDPEAEAIVEPEEEEPDGQVSITVTAVGDCTFGGMAGTKGASRFNDYVVKYGYDYFFENVRDLFEADDLTVVNLEGPLTTRTPGRKGELFLFRADPECVKILSGSSVELCNLANNHSQDCGRDGLKETAQVLDESGIGYCGYNVAYQETIKGVRVIALGFTRWERDTKDMVKAVKAAREACDLLIVNMHWGEEHQYGFNGAQSRMAHAIIDAGADLIIGTHPHVIQGIEKYKGKYIVYSLGNFSFAGNADPDDKRCLIFQQKFSFVPGMNMEHAGCADAGINLIPASVTSTAGRNDFKPMILPAEQGKEVLKLLAKRSLNFDVKSTLWMRGNYLLANGLMKTKEEADAEAAAAAAQAAEGGEDGEVAGMDIDTDAEPDADAAPWTDEEEDAPDADAAPWADEEEDASGAEAVDAPDSDEPAPFFG